MMEIQRHLLTWALSETSLHGRMSFIAGPRQIGKTTAVRRFLSSCGQERFYYNWDSPVVKKRYAANPAFFLEDLTPEIEKPWVAFDEIHKYPKWKNLLKGYYDEWKERLRFVVTGSARLDLFRRSGDSLVGRYFLFKMLPLGMREVMSEPSSADRSWWPGSGAPGIPPENAAAGEAVRLLLRIGGFPEPLTQGTEEFATRWRDQHLSLIVQEDLRDLTRISELRKLETLLYLLPERVGSPLSLNSLRQPLECAHGSLSLWLEALKKGYLLFSIPPWTGRLSRAVRKEEKYYFWDWGMVSKPGGRFENFLAVQLERAVSAWNEWGKRSFKLHYLRTKDGREVDFAVADRNQVRLLVEAKEGDESLSPHLPYFQERLPADLAIQVVHRHGVCTQKGKNLWIMGADRFLSFLP